MSDKQGPALSPEAQPELEAEQPELPLYKVSFINRLTFSWLDRLFAKGWKNPLVLSDMYKIPEQLNTERLSDAFWEEWNRLLSERLQTGDKTNPDGMMLRAVIWNIFARRTFGWGILLILSNLCNLFAPYFVQWILTFTVNKYLAHKNVPTYVEGPLGNGLALVFGLLATQVVGAFLSTHFTQEASIEAVRVRTMMTAVIYRKSLKLSSSARQEFSAGNVTNLISTDCNRVEMFINFANYIWTIPLSLAINIAFLIISLGWPVIAGIGLLILSGPLQAYLFSLIMKIRAIMAPITGKLFLYSYRVNLTTEVLSGVRVIKFFAWEGAFFDKVNDIRKSEIALVLRRSIYMAFVMTQGFAIPILCSCITFIIYGSINPTLKAQDIFSSMSWFNQLRMPLFMLPLLLNSFAEFNVAMRRIEALLLASEVESSRINDPEAEYAVSIENGVFEWTGEVYGHGFEKPKPIVPGKRGGGPGGKPSDAKGKPSATGGKSPAAVDSAAAPAIKSQDDEVEVTSVVQVSSLKDIDFKVEKGSLTAIVGAVGSGKSSLLNALIGEMRQLEGQITLNGTLGYAAQSAWIQNANLKENILFGRKYNKERYLNALLDAALLPDLKVLPDGDKTSIGEKGINLSGGQKQRVNLARLIYNDSDIVLIDDPLSAVDAHVGAHLFNRCIKGALSNRTRLLVTHQLHYLSQCDRVIFMKDGKITEQGTYRDLIDAGGQFAKMMASYGSESDDAHGVDVTDVKEAQAKRERDLDDLERLLEEKKTGKDMMTVEDQETGKVAARVWMNYVKASGGWFGFVLPLVFVLLIFQLSRTGNDLWLTYWTDNTFRLTNTQYIIGYIIFALLMTLSTFGYALFFAFSGTRASRNLHDLALERILRAPTSFYDTTPLGRILNRFSRDVDAVDNNLSFSFRQLVSQIGITISTFVVMCSALPWFTIPVIPALFVYYGIAAVYRTTAREMKRVDSTTKSPLYNNLGESLVGLATIRAYNDEHRFIVKNDLITDNNNSPYFLLLTAQNWLTLRLQLIGSLLVFCASLIGIISDLDPSMFGLTLSYSLSVTQILSMTIQNFTQTEIAMNSVERIEAYAYSVPVEADAIIKDNRPPKDWPVAGAIEFKEVVMRYAPTLPTVLNTVSFTIKSREKIGIVGRTGSGKSSLMQALFRMVEVSSGQIFIDGIDIGKIGLSDLRSRVAIIPQDPVVFSGSFRSNMDPFNEHTDNELWDALARAGLKAKVAKTEKTLDGVVDAGGENLSVGERQLLCLARAMLKTPKILIMDEATANVDYETDAMIQKALREDFGNATVLTIAHRLNTVIDYDKVMVLEKGILAEFDSPSNLLSDEGSMFSALVAQTGESNASMLRDMAK
ncbi:P-loop containing nucleoside triphosphate hydrolase protein [Chytriomyces sp. MP71]|nr:P-loop containing nucleoside triphosphate hydrolase protein [Chytriomyces sp. MP71]